MAQVLKPGGAVTAPRVIYAVDPQFTEKARRDKLSGIVVVDLIVDKSGKPTRIQVIRPLDPGLDQNAVVAVSRYRFAPAIFQGQPVSVRVNIEVVFRIY